MNNIKHKLVIMSGKGGVKYPVDKEHINFGKIKIDKDIVYALDRGEHYGIT